MKESSHANKLLDFPNNEGPLGYNPIPHKESSKSSPSKI